MVHHLSKKPTRELVSSQNIAQPINWSELAIQVLDYKLPPQQSRKEFLALLLAQPLLYYSFIAVVISTQPSWARIPLGVHRARARQFRPARNGDQAQFLEMHAASLSSEQVASGLG